MNYRTTSKWLGAIVAGMFAGLLSLSASAVTGAGFTTTNTAVDGTGHCQNGNEDVNCNIYDGKDFVWLTGGPGPSALGDGTYFFAVLVPGGQGGNENPNDCTPKNLSDFTPCDTSNTGAGDPYTNRIFSIAGGTISYTGNGSDTPHDFSNNKIRLMPYDDTTNDGGVYILAMCSLADGYPVKPSKCKYDMFKIKPASVTTLTITACKFNDVNNNGSRDSATEPLIPNWPITAYGVLGDTGSGVTQATEAGGCTFFDVNPGTVAILEEGTLGAAWVQTAPYEGLGGVYSVEDEGTPGAPHYVVTTVPLTNNFEIDFGNYNPACVPADKCGDLPGLSVTKTATNLTTWGVTKSASPTLIKQVGGNATFNYTVNATFTLSGTVTGTITLINTSPADMDVATLVDNLGAVGCTFPDTLPTIVAAGSTVPVKYSCSLTPPVSGTNSATVTWATFGGGSASGTAAIVLKDQCANVNDSYAGLLGTACVGAVNPVVYTYSRTVPVPAFGCVSYDNTATFTTVDTGATGSASQTVQVCGPVNTGALTMGFWQNNNGQGIIKTGAATAGVCNSGTWLRQYAPFQDLSATATCAQVATYVYNTIKAATCSSTGTSTCNTMLKAQMLATALDVYFSDPALGGNRISAPAPIGGVTIDLTKICTNIPTCSNFENDSAIFGSAALTVSQILTSAASNSNIGGSVWYAQIKATQVGAKDVFDAINNKVAFAP